MNKQKQRINPKHWLDNFGFCIHKWKFLRTEKGDYRVRDICECIKCGEHRGFRVW